MDSIIVQDDDAHWYLIPLAFKEQWDKWVGKQKWEHGSMPPYARMLDKPSSVVISSFRIE